MDCIFCKIISGEIPCAKVYEDDDVLAFFDISPISLGHTLLIPKKHVASYEEIDNETLARVFTAVKKVGAAIKTGLNIAGYNTGVNNGAVAGQIIPHFHVHIIPRLEGDGLKTWPNTKYSESEMNTALEKIITKL